MQDYFPTLRELRLTQKYGFTEESCLHLIWAKRYGKSPQCPRCKQTDDKWYRVATRKAYAHGCGWQLFPTAGTIFHKSRTPLSKWFEAIYLVYTSEGKIPMRELARQLGFRRISKDGRRFYAYKTPWRMKHQIMDYLGLELPKHGGYSYRYSSATNGRYSQQDYRKKHNLV